MIAPFLACALALSAAVTPPAQTITLPEAVALALRQNPTFASQSQALAAARSR